MNASQRILSTFIIVLAATTAWGANDSIKHTVYRGFSGGMLLHTGYLWGRTAEAPYSPAGMPLGIGGAVRIHLWKHLRIGGEGYVTTLYSSLSNEASALAKGSYVRYACGGLLADYSYEWEKIWLYVGGIIGGGAKRSLFIEDGNQNDWQKESSTYVNKTPYLFLAPYIGFDYCMTPKVHLSLKLDYTLAIHHNDLLNPSGFRLYAGFMFCH